MNNKRLKVALTGGLGSGKSTVLSLFQQAQWHTFSADDYVHYLLEQDLSVIQAIIDTFSTQVLDATGKIDRKRLSDIVFNQNFTKSFDSEEVARRDPQSVQPVREQIDSDRNSKACFLQESVTDCQQLNQLEAILHPRVIDAYQKAIADDLINNFIAEIPLLFEKKLENSFDFVVCVGCSPHIATQRLKQKQWPEHVIQARQACQWGLDQKLQHAQFIFWNDGTLEWLKRQVDRFLWITSSR